MEKTLTELFKLFKAEDCKLAKEYCSGDCIDCEYKVLNFMSLNEYHKMIHEEQKEEFNFVTTNHNTEDFIDSSF